MMANNKLLKEWKNRLCLTAWEIVLKDNLKPNEMTLEDVSGCTEWEESDRTARIEILDPKYYGERIRPFDYETTLVHELLHLKLSIVSSQVDDAQKRYMHQVIDDLARAFVNAKRSKNDETTRTCC